MLQQTQVPRVLLKYQEFLTHFPDIKTLSKAPLRNVLKAWQGLGYNRRAKFLHEASKMLINTTPAQRGDYTFLTSLPGVGPSTAGAVLVFTKNKPVVFIETNIRAVILHHFFKNTKEKVHDREVAVVLQKLLSSLGKKFTARDFYYALYDYGTYLKTTLGKERKTLHRKSSHYVTQSAFSGSRRQLRAFILKTFLEMKKGSTKTLLKKVKANLPKSLEKYLETDIQNVITDLQTEGFFK